VKRFVLVSVCLLSACDDSIPGLCKVDSDCAEYAAGGPRYCYLGVCVVGDDDGGVPDADGGVNDAGAQDAEVIDTGPSVGRDGGLVDAGPAGAEPSDASAPVASAPVASAPVASAPDASAPDASAPDASAPDASAPDGGPADAGADGGLHDAGSKDAGLAVLGTPCSAAGQCTSGYCVDGVCCDATCNDRACQRCDSYSTGGAGHCSVTKGGVDPDSECPGSTTSCSGLCNLQTTTYSCTGTSYTCSAKQTTSPIPSGSVCVSNAATKVSATNNCDSGNSCADGVCQASRWWTSCDGQGACRAASDATDALVQPVVAASGHSLTTACGTNGTSFCGVSCSSTKIYWDSCDGSGRCAAPSSSVKMDCGLYGCDASSFQCKTQCSAAADCAESYLCTSSICHWDWAWADWNMTSPPATRYVVDSGAGTVTDNMTGRVWQRGVSANAMKWSDSTTNPISYPAKTYCSSLSLAGGGWRLPTAIELLSIVKPEVAQPAIDTTVFLLGASSPTGDCFWTSTPIASDSSAAWRVGFDEGFAYDVADTCWVRCVR
jgi:hypothetical protein